VAAILFGEPKHIRLPRKLPVVECGDRRILGRILGGRFNLAFSARCSDGTMRREIPGLMAPLKVQVAVWLVGALAEETWRVTAIAALAHKSEFASFFDRCRLRRLW